MRPTLHSFFAWRFRWLFVAPILAVVLALLFVVVGSPYPREQLRRLGVDPSRTDNRVPTLAAVLLRVAEEYIDPSRIHPQRMVQVGVVSIEQRVPECISRQNGNILNFQCGTSQISINIEQIETIYDIHEAIQKLFSILPKNMSEHQVLHLRYATMNAMLDELDPHTVLLDSDLYQEIKTGTQGSFSGVGIVVTVRDGYLTVITPIDGTPAARAGIRPGDRIVRIGEIAVTNTSLTEAVNYLRGKPGTSVSIWVERENENQWLHFTLERSVIHLNSVTSSLLPGNIGYVRIRQFSQNTAQELRTHLEQLIAQNARSLILDLSNNPGGLLTQAEKSASLFLSDKTIFAIVGRNHRIEDVRRAPEGSLWKKPMIVLINAGSASAAEILAGALKVHDRALVMGENSFGKGSIQVIHEFDDDSALKMTVAHYLVGGKLPIHARGVPPHVHVRILDADNPKLFLQSYQTQKTDRLNISDGSKDGLWTELHLVRTRPENASDDIDVQAPPELIDAARRVLLEHGEKDWNPEWVRAWCATESSRSRTEIVESFGHNGIDWSIGEVDFQKIKLDAKLRLSDQDGKIRAGEPLAGILTVHHLGTSPVYRIAVQVQAGFDAITREYLVGRMDPGEHRTIAFSFPVAKQHPLAAWPVVVKFLHFDPRSVSRDFLPPDIKTWVRIQPLTPPKIQIHYQFMDDNVGNGDGLLQPGERGRLRLYIQNAGTEIADGVTVGFRVPSDAGIEFQPTRYAWNRLLPNEIRMQDIMMYANENTEPSDLSPVLFIETRMQQRSEMLLPLHVSAHAPGPIESTGIFQLTSDASFSGCAGQEWSPVGIAQKGSSFPVIGTQGQWVRIQLAPDRSAFVPRNVGNLITSENLPLLSPRWTPVWQVVLPSIDVLVELPLRTKKPQAPLSVRAFHPWRLLDAEVEVYGDNKQYLKVLFVSGQNRNELHLAPIVPLFLGQNRVVVSVRSTPELKKSWAQYVYREE